MYTLPKKFSRLRSLTCFVFFLLAASLIIPLYTVQPTYAVDPNIALKWTGYVAGGGEALLAADVRPDIPGMEIIHAGGGAQPGGITGSVTCLNGITGAQIWKVSISGIGDTCQPQMADLNNDGRLEIVVPIQYPAGIYILNSYDGSLFYSNRNLDGGRIDSNSVIGDVNGDGYPDLFVGVMAYEEQPNTGKLIHYAYSPSQGTMIELQRVQIWHPCAGGLSLGDTDNDGTFELYMNERDAYYGDGGWGRGITSFWAANLSARWRVYDWGASSNIPMLGDVNHDGIQDVISTDLSAGVCVLNSTDGHPLTNEAGQVLSQTRIPGRHNHYQSSVYDIDGDGNLEILSGDGYEGEFNYITVFDLYSWRLEASIDTTIQGPVLTRSWKGPTVGEVTGDGQMDIIVTTFDPTTGSNGQVQVYDRNYNLVYLYPGLRHRAIDSVIQDIDGNGKNELLILTQGGVIYCFTTLGITSNPLPRTEVHAYSESRCGASEYVPYHQPYPDISNPQPTSGALGVSASISSLSFSLSHPLGQTMSYTVTTSPNIGSGSGSNVSNGQRTVPISGLMPNTLYHWIVTATDQTGHTTSKDYSFTTGPYLPNRPPTEDAPTLSANTIFNNLVATAQNSSDPEGNPVTSIYNWQKNGVSIANLYFPFDTRTSRQDEYSGFATTEDYAYGVTASVVGANWVPNGKVGGAYSFDGNDFIRALELTRSSPIYDGQGAWMGVSVECWVKGTALLNSAKPLISKTDLYDSNISYRLDFCKTGSSLDFTWLVGTGNAASSTVYTLGPYSTTTGVEDWHHVVATYTSGSGLILYVDGAQVSRLAGPSYAGNILDTDGPFDIAFDNGRDFKGLVDEVKLYPYPLSASMVNQRYLDTKDGLSCNSTIPMYDLQVGDQWSCQVTPNDGFVDGQMLSSGTRTIINVINAPPTASNLSIIPGSPMTDDDLVANYTYFDAEGHPEKDSIVSWYRNSVLVTTGSTLPSNFTAEGDSWTFTVKPRDGFNFGTTVGPSNPVIIMSSKPLPTPIGKPTEPTPVPTLSPTPTYNPELTSTPTTTPSATTEPPQSPTNDPAQTTFNPTPTEETQKSSQIIQLLTVTLVSILIVISLMVLSITKKGAARKWRLRK